MQKLKIRSKITLLLLTSSLLLSFTPSSLAAEMDSEKAPQSETFQRIEQPLPLKIGVTVGGLALIGAQLWWFLFSQPKSKPAQSSNGIQEIDITVDGGYIPSRVVVKKGQPVRLKFLRQDPSSCLDTVLLPDFKISQALTLHQVTSIEFVPEQKGTYEFTCGMNMFRGAIEVQG